MTNSFDSKTRETDFDGLHAKSMRALQVNVGRLCNMTCQHCHLGASPERTEMMPWKTMEQVIEMAAALKPELVDITGGAPELHPNIQQFMTALHDGGHPLQLRTNFTALQETSSAGLIDFLAKHEVTLVGSLPCYLQINVDAQRGDGSYAACVETLTQLNAVGYGINESLPMHLVYNPGGPFLPPAQTELEPVYRRELLERFGIRFTQLFTITNMPIGRFAQDLEEKDELEGYREILKANFNPKAVDGLMCRHQICVDWDGRLFDCDFNIALNMTIDDALPQHVDTFEKALLSHRRIHTGEHCWGCTAGAGSSCGGALTRDKQTGE